MDTPTRPDLAPAALDFLQSHLKMVLAINEGEGTWPNASLMHYAVDDAMRVYFGTKRGFGKYRALVYNPKVSFVVVEENINPLRVADGRGIATELRAEEAPYALKFFKKENQSTWYVEGSEDFAMFRIDPTNVRWLDATSGELQVVDIPVPDLG